MKITIAAWHLRDFNVGLGRYCRSLIEAIGRVDADNRYEILMPDDLCRFPEHPNVRYRIIRFPLFKRRFWEQVAPLVAGSYDLLHLPYDSCVAWKRGKLVVTIHDVKPLIFGELRGSHNLSGLIQGWVVGDRWDRIDHVLTDSQSSRRDIMARLPVPADRITVVYPGVELSRFRPDLDRIPPSPTPLPFGEREREGGRPYVLCVAGADPTKNVATLVEAFGRLPEWLKASHELVLAGDFRRRGEVRELVARLGLEKLTVFTGTVSDDRLVALYQAAAAFVFPSRYEGFGLPVLEAMACGCPVISSNASSLPEVAGDGAVLVDPMDVEGFARAMEKVLKDDQFRHDLRARGLKQAAQFTWDRTARETIAVYKKVVGMK